MTVPRSHPLAMTTRFRPPIVLTFAFPRSMLAGLVPASLALETVDDVDYSWRAGRGEPIHAPAEPRP